MKPASLLLYALVVSATVTIALAPQIPLALVAIGAFALAGFLAWIDYKSNLQLDPYVRKIELLQQAVEEFKADMQDEKQRNDKMWAFIQEEATPQLEELQSKTSQLGMQVATRR